MEADFLIDGYDCRVSGLGTAGTAVRLLIYFDKNLRGVWDFVSSATKKNVKKYVMDKIKEIKKRNAPPGYYIKCGIVWDLNKMYRKKDND